ncbi:prephenate dehydrogenase/arogenate dehydrogenase family protein [Terrihabitans sp. B22-R8]|uniref:prephenate dehydrogenase/arogenate dehydrogenase family protein n=1 Tax=Terrihabitans sp. B22-R8 TaxID=3425128 RepID=UPI00403C35F7
MRRFTNPGGPLGIIGFGAFGRLAAHHLSPFFRIRVFDIGGADICAGLDVDFADLQTVASSPIVILAVPVSALRSVIQAIAPFLTKGALVLDVGSVKMEPAREMLEGLPQDVRIIATHPMFGPMSARQGIRGLKIVLCPLRGAGEKAVGRFLEGALGLNVILATPEEHDREAALAQGLTHLIAKILFRMENLPTRMTTRSFDLIQEAIEMVRDDAPEVTTAIETANPFSRAVRDTFLSHAQAVDREFAISAAPEPETGSKTGSEVLDLCGTSA